MCNRIIKRNKAETKFCLGQTLLTVVNWTVIFPLALCAAVWLTNCFSFYTITYVKRYPKTEYKPAGNSRRLFIHFVPYCSGRYGGWHSKDATAGPTKAKNVPRIIVFVMGGCSFSEFRAGYEVTNDRKNWEVIVGKWAYFFFIWGRPQTMSAVLREGGGRGAKNVPRIIIFVMGGACFSEFRAGYELVGHCW